MSILVSHYCCVDTSLDSFRKIYLAHLPELDETDRGGAVYYALMNDNFEKAQLIIGNNCEVFRESLHRVLDELEWRLNCVSDSFLKRIDRIFDFYRNLHVNYVSGTSHFHGNGVTYEGYGDDGACGGHMYYYLDVLLKMRLSEMEQRIKKDRSIVKDKNISRTI